MTANKKTAEPSILKDVLGLTEVDAVVKIQALGMKARVQSRDGKGMVGTCDYRLDRVNLSIENEKVTKATLG